MAPERLISPLRVELGPAGWKLFFFSSFFFFFLFEGPVCFSKTAVRQEPQRPRPTRRGIHFGALLVDSEQMLGSHEACWVLWLLWANSCLLGGKEACWLLWLLWMKSCLLGGQEACWLLWLRLINTCLLSIKTTVVV